MDGRPIANVTMTFVSMANTTRYNTVHSRINMSLHGYSLPPPHWRFLYTEENCTVVKVLHEKPSPSERSSGKKESTQISKYCELWAVQWNQWKSDSYKPAESSSLCEEAFSSMCENKSVYTVLDSRFC
ncbi:uncharacterized protein LOC142584713 [Dermacentor variabilis]|uniref:uncharacterized protein LOC142584713 n=1 Tax=Dermacentor variabilis TaxID=34621 RepID=UPI003F5B0FDF